jgi:pseudaminic acid synthase
MQTLGNNDIALLNVRQVTPPYKRSQYVYGKRFAERYNVISGLSDHTMGATVPIVATHFEPKS